MISLTTIADKLKGCKNVAIISHIHPDGDTIGSALGLSLALNKLNIKSALFCEDVIPKKFSYLNGIEGFMTEPKDLGFDAVVCVDCADITRLGVMTELLNYCKQVFVIDHHVSNTRFVKDTYVKDNASNCENILDLVKIMGVEIDGELATTLLTGISTDTGNFSHKNVEKGTFEAASYLMGLGADINKIYYQNFKMQSKERAKLFALTMNKLRYFEDGKIAISSVFLKDFESTGASPDETEGFIDFVLGIDGVEVAVAVMEKKPNVYKISFRSKTVNVNEVAGVFGGGGHVLASGCMINGEYEEVIDKVTFAIRQRL